MGNVQFARDLGRFLLVGKSRPVHVLSELVNPLVEATPREKEYCASFTEGMELFRRQAWRRRPKSSKRRSGSGRATGLRSFTCVFARATRRSRRRRVGRRRPDGEKVAA